MGNMDMMRQMSSWNQQQQYLPPVIRETRHWYGIIIHLFNQSCKRL